MKTVIKTLLVITVTAAVIISTRYPMLIPCVIIAVLLARQIRENIALTQKGRDENDQ